LEGCAVHGVVDAGDRHLGILELENTAGAKDGEGGGDDEGGVTEAGEEGAAVDVVEFLGVGPVFFCVGDFEAAVWWDAVSVSGDERERGRAAY
jgi:hypothetical protein